VASGQPGHRLRATPIGHHREQAHKIKTSKEEPPRFQGIASLTDAPLGGWCRTGSVWVGLRGWCRVSRLWLL